MYKNNIIYKIYKHMHPDIKNEIIRPTGIELITYERDSQIKKHKWNLHDDHDYGNSQLIKAALFAINSDQFEWPFYWDEKFRDKILQKNYIERLTVAGALIASQIDREIEVYFKGLKK